MRAWVAWAYLAVFCSALQATEIHRRLGVLAEPPDPVGLDRHRQRGLARLGAQREVGEQRGVDTAGEVAPFPAPRGICLDLADDRPGLRRVLVKRGEPGLDG
jgi:hypothetical protein